ncbi:hypothetical protein A1OK_22090 [Enterovibrio norvegicus FF-454]|uniref:Glycosyltransferase 2-like domain-containing protein n=1 Tax=Enterovibrio norvegicus FF-454 TaxID=1185651 RepID=A0A1E5C7D1_9GAMM|nr:hypothetical protein [Enterovibrio norvegicus]OEE61102.1 hypothetical protein A1OK_22090 [Enterovibrio norvegicus FF-454]
MEINKCLSFVSVVLIEKDIPITDLSKIISEINRFLSERYSDYEIVIIEEGVNTKNTALWNKILTEIDAIRVIQVSNSLDRETAQFVGLENAIGDHVILFNSLTDPLEIIEQGVQKNNDGFDIVGGVDSNPIQSISYRIVRPVVSHFLKKIGYVNERNSTEFYCLSRNAVNSLTISSSRKYNLHVRVSQCAMEKATIIYKVDHRYKKNRKRVRNSIPYALNMIIFNSVIPLKYMAMLGIVASIFSLLFATYSFIQKLLNNVTVDGWASITILVSLLFTILFVILSFFAEYLSRLLDESDQGKPYWIISEKTSSVMVNEERYNVMDNSQ